MLNLIHRHIYDLFNLREYAYSSPQHKERSLNAATTL